MGRIERLKYGWLSVRAWISEKRATPRWAWWSGFGYAYMMAGFLQAAVFSKTVAGLTVSSFFKFVLIWPLWSYSVVVEDYPMAAGVLEFVFDIEVEELKPAVPAKRPAEAWPV